MTGELKSKIDRIWDAFWSGGISNPMEVIEQITYLLFVRRLDDLHTLAENKANRTGKPIEKPVFPDGVDEQGYPWSDLRESAGSDVEKYSLILANPPFAGSLDYETTAKDLHRQDQEDRAVVLRALPAPAQAGGRAAIIVPDGVLFGWRHLLRRRRSPGDIGGAT